MRDTQDVYFAFMARFLNRYPAQHYLPFWQDSKKAPDWVLLSCQKGKGNLSKGFTI